MMYLTSGNLKVPHGFFGRKGGVSEGIFASLNCGRGSSDRRGHVEENRARVASALGASADQLLSLYQVHGAEAVTVSEPWKPDRQPRADAMVTRMPGIALGILAADCVPVLFADAEARVIGAAHAGWKGATGGVLEATVATMLKLGAKAEQIHAAIGPSIMQQSYEVDDVRRGDIVALNPAHAGYFKPSDQEHHWLFDLRGLAHDRLLALGLGSINRLENDTYMEEDVFFSFRRTTHRREPDYGRQISAIMLTK